MEITHVKTNYVILIIIITFLTPFIFLIYGIQSADISVLQTFVINLLPRYLLSTLLLIAGVLFVTIALGTSMAWISFQFTFPLHTILRALLPFSIIISPYMLALFFSDYADSISISIIKYVSHFPMLAISNSAIISIINFIFLVFSLSLSLYPYTYMFVKATYERNSFSIIQSAQLLNKGKKSLFFKIGLPIAKTAIIGGSLFISMDVLNEFASIIHFGYNTISSGIYKTWFLYKNLGSAQVISLGVLLFILCIVSIMQKQTKNISYQITQHLPVIRRPLPIRKGIVATLWCSLPVLFGLILPLISFTKKSIYVLSSNTISALYDSLQLVSQTFIFIIIALVITTVGAIIISYEYHLHRKSKIKQLGYKITTFGYALPGTVLAITILGLFYTLDTYIFPSYSITSLFLSKTYLALLLAIVIRYFYVLVAPIYTGFAYYGKQYERISYTLGKDTFTTFKKIALPLNMPFILAGMFLFVMDVLKEIPITLVLRPYNFTTLSLKTYLLAREERITESSIPLLLTVVMGCIFLLCFKIIENHYKKTHTT